MASASSEAPLEVREAQLSHLWRGMAPGQVERQLPVSLALMQRIMALKLQGTDVEKEIHVNESRFQHIY